MNARLVATDGTVVPLDVERFTGASRSEEDELLRRAAAPVIDIGCGPGRHVLALAERGLITLGIDVSPHAIALARARGAPVIRRSIFDHIPRAGRWNTALLLDGNIGIGGDPVTLLQRVRSLLRRGGRVLVETGPPNAPSRRLTVRVEHGGDRSEWFPWAVVSAADLDALCDSAGLAAAESWQVGTRWFGCLAR